MDKMVKGKRKMHFAGEKKMKFKWLTCAECKFRKFETINALNVHIGKSHTVDYKVVIRNNQIFTKKKTRATVQDVSKIKK